MVGGVAMLKRLSRTMHARWHALRHPPGWYDEVNEVYGRDTHPDARKSAGAAGIGGHISGGGP